MLCHATNCLFGNAGAGWISGCAHACGGTPRTHSAAVVIPETEARFFFEKNRRITPKIALIFSATEQEAIFVNCLLLPGRGHGWTGGRAGAPAPVPAPALDLPLPLSRVRVRLCMRMSPALRAGALLPAPAPRSCSCSRTGYPPVRCPARPPAHQCPCPCLCPRPRLRLRLLPAPSAAPCALCPNCHLVCMRRCLESTAHEIICSGADAVSVQPSDSMTRGICLL